MFRDRHEHGQWLSSDFKIKDEDPNKLMFGDKEVTIFRVKYGNHVHIVVCLKLVPSQDVMLMFKIMYPREPGKIPWNGYTVTVLVCCHPRFFTIGLRRLRMWLAGLPSYKLYHRTQMPPRY
ncbi:hypothetical protein SEVIR_9G101133v4 [Setaria viridis]